LERSGGDMENGDAPVNEPNEDDTTGEVEGDV
jgi:hypothetical protein